VRYPCNVVELLISRKRRRKPVGLAKLLADADACRAHPERLGPLLGPEADVSRGPAQEREFFIDNLLLRIHLIIIMIRWTGLAPR